MGVQQITQHLDDDGVGRQVDSPGQGRSTDQHLDVTSGEHALREVTVRAQHASVMDTKTFWEDLLHLFVPGALELREKRHVTIGQNYGIRTLLRKKNKNKKLQFNSKSRCKSMRNQRNQTNCEI